MATNLSSAVPDITKTPGFSFPGELQKARGRVGHLTGVLCALLLASPNLVDAALAQGNPAPRLTAVAPDVLSAGAAGGTLVLEGSGFDSRSKVQWKGVGELDFSDRPPASPTDSTHVRLTLFDSDLDLPGVATVRVFNPSPGGTSDEKDVLIGGVLYFPMLDRDSDLFTGLFTGVALANVSSDAALTRLEAFRIDGSLIESEQSLEVTASNQIAKTTKEIFSALGDTDSGWFRVKSATGSTLTNLKGFFLHGRNNLASIDGVDVNDRLSTELIFPLVAKSSAEESQVALVNPNPMQATLTIELFGRLGSHEPFSAKNLKKQNFTLRPRERIEKTISQLFESELTSLNTDIPTLFGSDASAGQLYLRVTSDLGLFGFQTFGERTSAKDFVALRGQDRGQESGNELFFAHLAEGLGYETLLSLINLKPETASASVDVQIVLDSGVSQIVNQIISPKGLIRVKLRDLFPSVIRGDQVQVGYITATSRAATVSGVAVTAGPLMGSITFSHPFFGATAALPGQRSPASRLIFSHVAVQNPTTSGDTAFLTGVALLNPSTANDASVTIKVRKADGTVAGEKTFTLKAKERTAKLLSELVPEVREQVGGYIVVDSTFQPLYGFELFGDWGLRKLASVPAQ